MRCFIALVPPPACVHSLRRYLAQVEPLAPGWRWVRAEQIHLTLAFLGDVGPEEILAASAAVHKAAAMVPPVPLVFRVVRPFPSAARPRVLALVPDKGSDLADAARDIVNRLLSAETAARRLPVINPDWVAGAGFRPHLSLARPARRDVKALMPIDMPEFGTECHDFSGLVLFESILRPAGPDYSPLVQAVLRS
jgi:2'-5' RNA ligase